ncbi:hypothetical protein GGTG_13741 [Gaeumannomyces tritici R3-111a-1]|uniref:Uncharacterized protein n=1 Tax=Gaeumannomyces tritici (strain R3-111a-1) TaxID=644352 RepID=J3PJQ2_GAET3|nr:hypothetical protein, variant [Gaeumannomyces tritici R3-111a-1]XP_009229924.1 hypothetical protein GGTG_13741 [Gaeumannomyces tritici R3-111a-1]EJT68687.1 hypothetical protein, variant [Gaeumannomyces tritici R3-111a-1]EJT68688.1 hypothetical protein GGTG_13741 [Gaeumannomyces tritici R3-111a-1]
MCDFEEFIFTCGCSEQRLQSYCHYARNDPQHRCRRVRKLRSVWDQNVECERHMRERWMQWQWQQQQGGQGQGGQAS